MLPSPILGPSEGQDERGEPLRFAPTEILRRPASARPYFHSVSSFFFGSVRAGCFKQLQVIWEGGRLRVESLSLSQPHDGRASQKTARTRTPPRLAWSFTDGPRRAARLLAIASCTRSTEVPLPDRHAGSKDWRVVLCRMDPAVTSAVSTAERPQEICLKRYASLRLQGPSASVQTSKISPRPKASNHFPRWPQHEVRFPAPRYLLWHSCWPHADGVLLDELGLSGRRLIALDGDKPGPPQVSPLGNTGIIVGTLPAGTIRPHPVLTSVIESAYPLSLGRRSASCRGSRSTAHGGGDLETEIR